jgi:hypothetical protein
MLQHVHLRWNQCRFGFNFLEKSIRMKLELDDRRNFILLSLNFYRFCNFYSWLKNFQLANFKKITQEKKLGIYILSLEVPGNAYWKGNQLIRRSNGKWILYPCKIYEITKLFLNYNYLLQIL